MKRQEFGKPCYTDELDPDHHLLSWEKWIKTRNKDTKTIAEKTGRSPADLAMNLLYKVRADKERKTALENAQISIKPDVRGCLWEQNQRLKQKHYYDPIYEVQRTATEKGRPLIIEHVGVPNYILINEEGVTGVPTRKHFIKLDGDYDAYRRKREKELEKPIKKINPYKSSIDNLVIKGSQPKPIPFIKNIKLPDISITDAPDTYPGVLMHIYALKINNTIIAKDIPGQNLDVIRRLQGEKWHESCTSWSYYFNVPVRKAGRAKMFLMNLGSVSIRYCWKRLKRPIPFIPEDTYEQVFFFNKNEDVLAPGQCRDIVFTFVSHKPGIYSEFWELSPCNICFFDTMTDKLVINLYADSVEEAIQISRNIDIFKIKINVSAVKNMIRSIINEAIDQATVIKPEVYPYNKLFLEADIFVMKNPPCYYHQTEVGKMKDMYAEMIPDEDWDLSITSWRKAMMAQEYEERMRYYELLRISYRDLLKPWYEGENLKNQKYRAIRLFLGKLGDKFDIEYERLSQLYGIRDNEDVAVEASDELLFEDVLPDDPMNMPSFKNIFYLCMYEHVANTIELCAGVLSSLDQNRWIDFDFCR